MATITRENIGKLNDKLVVTIKKEDYLPAFEKNLKAYAKQANMPGFRKGMVPAGLVKKMYGQGLLTDEVSKTIDKELNNYVVKENIPVLVQPIPLEEDNHNVSFDVNHPADYTFSFEIGLTPEVNVDLKQIKATRYVVDVTDEMVNDEIDRLQVRHGKYSEPETITGDDDVLNIELKESDKDGNLVEGGATKATSILFKNVTAATQKKLKGQSKDFSLVIALNKAFENKDLENILAQLGFATDDKDAAKKYFQLTITKLGHVERPELTEDFFKQVYPDKEIKTEEAFKEEIKAEISKYFAQQASGQIHDQIFHYLTDHTTLEFPSDFLKRYLTLTNNDKKSAEEIDAEVPKFEKQLQWSIISNKLSEANDVKVEQSDLKDYARQQLFSYLGNQMDLSEQPAWLDDYVNKMIKDQKFVEQAYGQILASKLFTKLEEQISVKDEPISEAAFYKKLQEHTHEH